MYRIVLFFSIATLITACEARSKTVKIDGASYKTIPGLTVPQLRQKFDSNGFTLKENLSSRPNTWTATSINLNGGYTVIIDGDGPSDIISVDGTYAHSGNGDLATASSKFLELLASIRYSGADPRTAIEWAKRKAGPGGDTVISDVHFRIIPSSWYRIIRISME
jgi:hypothetical protein